MKLKEFIENDFIHYPIYDNTRKIASYIDGLKNSSRKVLFTFLDKNINNSIKVSRAVSIVAEHTNYLHGEVSLEGVIVNMAQNFTGANNLPLLYPDGHFGDRLSPEPSASRYIFTKLQPYTRLIYRKEDDPILEKQYFEGDEIEYKFYVPIIPIILVNGSEGVSTGYAQKILPRKLDTIIHCIIQKLSDKTCRKLEPYFRGFQGEIRRYENGWEIVGKIERKNKRLYITEVPVGYTLKSYLKVLDKLEEQKVIRSYKDMSQDGKFLIELSTSREFYNKDDNEILQELKLIKKVVENFTCINENNRIIEFQNEFELLDRYIEIRLEYYKKRKEFQLQNLKREIEFLADRAKFIKAVIDEKLTINKRKYDVIMNDAKKLGIMHPEKHLEMKISLFTREMIDKLKASIKKMKDGYTQLKSKKPKDIWIDELQELQTKLKSNR